MIATVAIGELHRARYERVFRPSVERYAARHGFDLIVFGESLCPPALRHATTISMNKLLIPFQPEVRSYDKVLVLDSDVLVNAKAPPFDRLELGNRVGIVDEWSQPTPSERAMFQEAHGLETTPSDYYRLAGLDLKTDAVLNGGMFICRPGLHGAFFEDVVDRRLAAQVGHPRGFHYEQAVLGYELWSADLPHLLSSSWNIIWPRFRWTFRRSLAGDGPQIRLKVLRFLDVLFRSSHFVHFAAGQDHDMAAVVGRLA